ncbi:phage tail protein [Pantoea sp. CCBC3-3-1]|uniref:phage tail protein n=1 Tax=Pantoea sp. CCBC3-3-1 TaxID=2490851 RepID=UPI0020C2CBAD|nr:phage tail protein [Pantoea sp. CCBC3-3-1]
MGFYDDLLDAPASTDTGSTLADDSSTPAEPSETTGKAPVSESDSPGDEAEPVTEATSESDSNEGESDENTGSTDNAGTVPDAITSRPASADLRTRFTGNKAFNDMVREDWIKAIQLNADAFDALLFRAQSPSEVVINDDGFEATEAERIDPNQETLTYADPELVVVVDCPDEMAEFYAMNDSDENTGAGESALILRIAAHNITIGSILEWNEDLASGESIRRWWYVHRKFNYGTASVGTLYYCVPSRSYEGILNGD